MLIITVLTYATEGGSGIYHAFKRYGAEKDLSEDTTDRGWGGGGCQSMDCISPRSLNPWMQSTGLVGQAVF